MNKLNWQMNFPTPFELFDIICCNIISEYPSKSISRINIIKTFNNYTLFAINGTISFKKF